MYIENTAGALCGRIERESSMLVMCVVYRQTDGRLLLYQDHDYHNITQHSPAFLCIPPLSD